MHTYLSPGNYRCQSVSIAKTLVNCPFQSAFVMKSYYSIGSKPSDTDYYLIHEYTRVDGGERVLIYYEKKNDKWTSHPVAFKDDLASSNNDYPGLMRCRTASPDLNSTSIPVGGYYYATTQAVVGKNTPESKYGYALIFGNGPDRTGQIFISYDGYLYYKSVYGADPATYKWRKLQGTAV